jgi:DNA-binding CsgD family transcriptional regulator
MPVPELSFMEDRIVALFAAGKGRSEIATTVQLDERTVEWHLVRAIEKLERVSRLHRDLSTRLALGGR